MTEAPITLRDGPRGVPLLGVLPLQNHEGVEFYRRVAREYGDAVRLQFGLKRAFLFSNPREIETIFKQHAKDVVKSATHSDLSLLLGGGLLISEGENWQARRKAAQPAFH